MARSGFFQRRPAGTPKALHAQQFGYPTSRGTLAEGEVTRRTRISFQDRQQIYVQNPFYRNGVMLSTGDCVREWMDVVDEEDAVMDAENQDWQEWSRSINLKRKVRDGLVQAHVFDNGILEIVYDDDLPPHEPPAPGAMPVDVAILPRQTTNLVLRRQEDGSYRLGAVHRPFGGDKVNFHPDRVFALEVQPNPEDIGGLSTAESAYHDALSYLQASQSLGDIVRHHGPGFKWAKVTDDDQATIDMMGNLFAGKGAKGKGSGQEMLRGAATGSNVEMENFDASSLDVTPFYEAMRMGIASALGLPVSYLEGVQAGAVSGSQTNRAFIQDQVSACRDLNIDPLIVFLMDKRYPDAVVNHKWRPFASLPSEEATMFRDCAGGIEALVRAGVPLHLALRESGLPITEEELGEAPDVDPFLEPVETMPLDPDNPDLDAAFDAYEAEALLLAAKASDGVVREAWDRAFREVSRSSPGHFDPEARQFMRQFHFASIRRLAREEREIIRRLLLESIADGLGTDDAARRLATEFRARRSRLNLIARTELNRAANYGRLTGYIQSGVVEGKECIATHDDRVRPDHLAADGEIVPVDKPFTRGAARGRMSPPFAPNCRCSIAPVVKGDTQESLAGLDPFQGLFADRDDRPAFHEIFPFLRSATNQYERSAISLWNALMRRVREVVER